MARSLHIRNVVLSGTAYEDLQYWQNTNPKIVQKINELIDSILEDPGGGIGKPERLQYELSGVWSRRINQRDRIVYQVEDATLIILQLRDHN